MSLVGIKKQKIDLLKRYGFDAEKHDKLVTRLKYILPGAAAAAVLAGAIGILFFKGLGIQSDINDTQEKIDNLKTQQQAVLELQEKNQALTYDYTNLTEAKEKASTESDKYSYFGEQLLTEVEAVCGDKAQITLMDFSSEGILFTFETTSGNYTDIAGIVDGVEALGSFESVNYTGYSQTGDGIYSFSISCRFEDSESESEAAE